MVWGSCFNEKAAIESDEKSSEIYFTGTISSESINRLIKQINTKITNHVSTEVYGSVLQCDIGITLFLDSGGGSVFDAFKFIDYISIIRKQNRIKYFNTVITGTAFSAATLIAVIGDTRYITPMAYTMIHELSAASGFREFTKLRSHFNMIQTVHNNIVAIYTTYTSKTKEEIENLLATETWYEAKAYLENGFVDKIF